MKALLTRGRELAMSFMGIVVSCALVACGGGGGGSSSSSGSGGGGGSAAGASIVLTGVVATGAPLIGATVSVVDGRGVSQGATVSSLADGSYEMTLSSTSPTMPLLIQANGVDMYGSPVVLYSVAQAITTGSNAKTLVHVTPLTNAVTALLLGGNPRPHFQNASTRYSTWALLGNSLALTAASTFVKTAIRANLTDARLTDIARVDFFKDSTFAANKTGLDAVLEGVRVQFGTDISGNELLQLSNRLILAGNSEVTVNLTTAKSNLAGTTPAVAAGAVTSTLKVTTGTSTVMPSVAGLDTLSATINLALAQRATDLDIALLGIFATSYTFYDGRDLMTMAGALSAYGASGYQLSRWQILGCLDDPMPTRGCAKIKVASLVRDASGGVVDIFHNVVTYSSTTGWTFRGNDRQTPWYVYPITWSQWDASGVLDTSVSPNPGLGMQVVIQSPDFMIATLQLPNGYSVPFYYCSISTMCLTGDPGTSYTTGLETGDLIADQVLRSTMVGWIGQQDARPGARYLIQTATLSAGSETNTTILTTDLPLTSSMAVYPLPDGLSASTPLTATNLTSGLTVAWSTWAAANPQLRMIEVRGVITSTTTAPVTRSVTVLPLAANQATLPVFATIPSDAVAYALWLIAQDEQGRRYVSKIAATP